MLESHKLILNWDSIKYEGEVAILDQAQFSGPVLQISEQISPNDSINLDFTEQNMQVGIFIPKHYYIATLRWENIEYKEGIVYLYNSKLEHSKVGSLKNLQENMSLVIDCSKHEMHSHYKFLVYPAWVVNSEGKIL